MIILTWYNYKVMEMILVTLIVIIILALVAIAYTFNKRLSEIKDLGREDEAQKVLMEWLKDMRGSLDKNLGQVQDQLQKSNQTLNQRLDNAARVVGTVSKELGQMSEMTKRMKDLQDFLQSPKLRGNVGEQILRDLLEQILPRETYAVQYGFKDGQIVDAISKTERGIIPIDSKFTMESYTRMIRSESSEDVKKGKREFVKSVKKHVDDISKKYILPQEGTLDFALMYVPSEAVYYEIVMSEEDLNSYAQNKKVLFVSPNSFYYFLKVIVMGLQEKRIAEGARRILETLEAIRHETAKFGEDLSVLTGHINRAKNSADNVSSKFQLLSGKIEQTKHLRKDEEAMQLEMRKEET